MTSERENDKTTNYIGSKQKYKKYNKENMHLVIFI